jgi:hypothetical protein
MVAPSVHPIAAQKSSHAMNPQAGPRTFELIISKSTQRLEACGGQISPGSTRRRKILAWGHSQLPHKVASSWARQRLQIRWADPIGQWAHV